MAEAGGTAEPVAAEEAEAAPAEEAPAGEAAAEPGAAAEAEAPAEAAGASLEGSVEVAGEPPPEGPPAGGEPAGDGGHASPVPDGAGVEPGMADEEGMAEEEGQLRRGSPEFAESPEGAEDSGMLGDESPTGMEDDEGEGDEFDEEEEEDAVDPLEELKEKYDSLLELNERAMQTNVALQRRVIQRKMGGDKPYDPSEKPSEGKVTEHKYLNVLYNVHSVRLKLRLQQVKAARMSDELKNQLEAKRQKAIECRDSFQEFKRQVARHAEYARTGKKIPDKIIQEVEEFELDKDAEVEEVRGSNISLKNRLSKLELQLRKKDELAENLHVIDFEQLKIENQTLNEKIEERNEELHKLRKKTTVTVQIITHMREKVQFVQQEYQALKQELAQLDLDLAAQRDLVAKTKHERDDYRGENTKLRQQTGIVNSEHLTRDYDNRTDHIKKLADDIETLKARHKQMTQFIKKHGGVI